MSSDLLLELNLLSERDLVDLASYFWASFGIIGADCFGAELSLVFWFWFYYTHVGKGVLTEVSGGI